jgi:hypothetical protein
MTKKTSPLADEFFKAIHPNNVIDNAQRIVSSAVNVLEEEIAAGILAAKNLEKKFINVDENKDSSNELMQRIRRDTHEAVDLFMDALTAISAQMGIITNSLKKETETETNKEQNKPAVKKEQQIIILEPENFLQKGSKTTLTFQIAADESETTKEIKFQKADFIGANSTSISSRNISIKPDKMVLNKGEEKEFSIVLSIPKNAEVGKYNCLLQDTNDPMLRVLISIEIN